MCVCVCARVCYDSRVDSSAKCMCGEEVPVVSDSNGRPQDLKRHCNDCDDHQWQGISARMGHIVAHGPVEYMFLDDVSPAGPAKQ